jgi:hypothetical protein
VAGVQFLAGTETSVFITTSRLAQGLTQPCVHRVPAALSLGVKHLRWEAEHSPPSSSELTHVWSSNFHFSICLHGVVLKHSHNFIMKMWQYFEAVVANFMMLILESS